MHDTLRAAVTTGKLSHSVVSSICMTPTSTSVTHRAQVMLPCRFSTGDGVGDAVGVAEARFGSGAGVGALRGLVGSTVGGVVGGRVGWRVGAAATAVTLQLPAAQNFDSCEARRFPPPQGTPSSTGTSIVTRYWPLMHLRLVQFVLASYPDAKPSCLHFEVRELTHNPLKQFD
jgi:hypothetical protein